MFVVVTACLACWGVLFAGLVRTQIVRHEEYQNRAERQHTCRVEVPCDRGRILDRNGVLLAGTLSSPSIIANPSQIRNTAETAARLAPILGLSCSSIRSRISRGGHFVWLERKTEPAVAERALAENLPGVYTLPEKDRVHPRGELARLVVGITDVDNRGLEGVEKCFDDFLGGEPGWQVLQRIPERRSRSLPDFPAEPPRDGCDVVLTLDARIQSAVELELGRAVEEHGASWGMALAMDPATGEILALAATEPGAGAEAAALNRCVAAQFEPGSTYKLITYAAALEEGVVRPEDVFDAGGGKMNFGGYTIHDPKEYDSLTVREAFEFSSNIVTAQVALRLGAEALYSYSRAFGIGARTGVELPGEVTGMLRRPCEWSRRSLATVAIGHEVAVNLIQMVSAYAAVANDGVLMEPRIVREILSPEGKRIRGYPPVPVRRVVSRETASLLRDFLRGVVERGTGRAADLGVLQAAGKSGTAQMLEEGGGFSNRRYTSSFIGFVPVEEPRIVVAVVLVDLSGVFYGGLVAAPVFREILWKTACCDLSEPLRDVLERDAAGRWAMAERTCRLDPAPAPEARPGPAAAMPALVGLPLREAKRVLLDSGMRVRCEGTGTVTAQDPSPGVALQPGERSYLKGSGT